MQINESCWIRYPERINFLEICEYDFEDSDKKRIPIYNINLILEDKEKAVDKVTDSKIINLYPYALNPEDLFDKLEVIRKKLKFNRVSPWCAMKENMVLDLINIEEYNGDYPKRITNKYLILGTFSNGERLGLGMSRDYDGAVELMNKTVNLRRKEI